MHSKFYKLARCILKNDFSYLCSTMPMYGSLPFIILMKLISKYGHWIYCGGQTKNILFLLHFIFSNINLVKTVKKIVA